MVKRHHLRAITFFFVLLLGWHTSAMAQSVTGLQITADATQSDPVTLELADLDALPQQSFTTSTIWTDGAVTFSGVSLAAVLESIGAKGTAVEMVALNDYKVTMPLAQLEETAPIIATRMDGNVMSVRDKGPYWIVFPYDQDPKYQTETIYSLSIWQLNRLKVVD
ncbi:oxidoreductase [uncultured Tateyamaria sp.]|uniref:oxidoreductase n=1 Tax=uncultured Tateyamaria sp. TaxID=455651 RepID=UPI0026156433|nr:oxidoreductase [uncultured Tateyamaria sp.]